MTDIKLARELVSRCLVSSFGWTPSGALNAVSRGDSAETISEVSRGKLSQIEAAAIIDERSRPLSLAHNQEHTT